MAGIINVDRTTYSKYEKEMSSINAKSLIRLAEFFGVSVDYLCSLTDKKSAEPDIPADYIADAEFAAFARSHEAAEILYEYWKLSKKHRTQILGRMYDLNDRAEAAEEFFDTRGRNA